MILLTGFDSIRSYYMEVEEYKVMYELEGRYWWHVSLRRVILSFIARGLNGRQSQQIKILDAGCGTGILLTELRNYHYRVGLDISSEALKFCQQRKLQKLVQGSVMQIPFKGNCFDLIASIDVIYHRAVGDDVVALREFHRVLNNRGKLILNLPAFDFLKSSHDEAIHTRRRYTRRELKSKLESVGFKIESITYRNVLLFPLLIVLRLLAKLKWRRGHARSDLAELPKFMNEGLKMVMALEERLMRRVNFPFGLSVFCLARK